MHAQNCRYSRGLGICRVRARATGLAGKTGHHGQPVCARRRRRRFRASAVGVSEQDGRPAVHRREHRAAPAAPSARRARRGGPGDGYTFFLGAVHHTIAESLYTKLPYSLTKDFIPVTVLAYVPNVVVVHPKHANINSLKDLMAYAKANPGKLNFGSAGSGTTHHLAGELFKTMTGLDIDARALQGRRPDDAGPARGPGRHGLRRHGHLGAADQGRQAEAACGHDRRRVPSRSRTCRRCRKPGCRATRSRPGTRSGP